jgi:hypothetical protein
VPIAIGVSNDTSAAAPLSTSVPASVPLLETSSTRTLSSTTRSKACRRDT